MEIINIIAEVILYSAFGLCLWTYLVYPFFVAVIGKLFRRSHFVGKITPSVTLIIPVHNEATVLAEKINNSLLLDYPKGQLQIIVVSDGSNDGSDEIIKSFAPRGVEYLRIPVRGGKPSAINEAVKIARSELLLLCDANTIFMHDVVKKLVRHFADESVGAVSGDVRLQGRGGVTAGEGIFWKIERMTQIGESAIGSVIGVDGGMYMLRRELYTPNKSDTLIDDFVIAMNVANAGRRVLLDAQAIAIEDAVEDAGQEFRRRVRTIAGGFQSMFEGRGRPPLKNPFLLLAYISHKALRWTGPVWLILLFASNLTVAAPALSQPLDVHGGLLLSLLAMQIVFYLLAVAGHLQSKQNLPTALSFAYYFCLSNIAAIFGFIRWLRKSQSVTWLQAQRRVVVHANVESK